MRGIFSDKPSRIVYGIQNYNKPIKIERIKQIVAILEFSSEFDVDFFPEGVYQAIHAVRGKKGKISLDDKINYDLEEGIALSQLKRDEHNPDLIVSQ